LKKTALILVVLLALLGGLAAVPYWFGQQAERAYHDLLEQATRDGRVTLSNARYERGWLSSAASATVTPLGLPLGITVESVIRHGPFPLLDGLQWTPYIAYITSEIKLPAAAALPPLALRTLIELDRSSTTRFELPAHRIAGPTGDGAEWQAGSGEFGTDAEARRLKASFTLPAIEVRGAAGKANFTRLGLRVDRRPAASGLSLVDFDLSLDRLAASGPKGQPVLEGLRLAMTSEESAGVFGLGFSLDLRELNDGDTAYGPIQLALKLGNLDSALLAAFQKQLGADNIQAAGKALELLAALAQKAPELELTRLSVKTRDGEISGRGKLVLDGSKLNIAENPMLLLSALNGEIEVLVPSGALKVLAEKDIGRRIEDLKLKGRLTEQEIKQLTPEKLAQIRAKVAPKAMEEVAARWHLVPAGEGYRLGASLRQGRLLVNGKPLDQPIRLSADPAPRILKTP
jgi:uncharacterized protein YdgA (DUF945 family)